MQGTKSPHHACVVRQPDAAFACSLQAVPAARALRWSSDFRGVPAASDGLRTWDLTTGRNVHTLEADENLKWMQVSADGQRALTASGNRTITVWDLSQGVEVSASKGAQRAQRAAIVSRSTGSSVPVLGHKCTACSMLAQLWTLCHEARQGLAWLDEAATSPLQGGGSASASHNLLYVHRGAWQQAEGLRSLRRPVPAGVLPV